MSKTFFVFLVFTSLLCLMAPFVNAFDFFDQVEPGKKIQISDSKYQDKVFGGDEQQKLIIKFIPGGTDLSHDAGEADGKDGDYAIIVDTDGDNQLNDESIITSGNVKRLSGVVYQMDRTQLSQLPDGAYNVWVVMDNIANGSIDW
ncbi:hypothetical protein FJZ33_11355, partial [Candidatus Poribacteria bacterium]|nr:hypothetical protein [Candidatus Poribacteria bacterium]